MLFLADEDFPGIAVRWLREVGHDVLWARTDMPGQADAALLATAQAEFSGSFCVVEAARVRRRPLETGRLGG
jgi:hypothetical protein